MTFLYSITINLYFFIVWVTSLFNAKAKLFIKGRENLFAKLNSSLSTEKKRIWFHFASLGEFEQGRTVLEQVKSNYKEQEIIVTFFSPSGYEIRKNYPGVKVFYLPMDSLSNAKKFIEIVNPSIAIFTKYEFWHFYFSELKHKGVPLFLISSIFRDNQPFFRWYGNFNREILKCVTHFFVQNKESVSLLSSINLNNVTLAGDTRFDRVFENAIAPKRFPIIDFFLAGSPTCIAGSTWPEDEGILSALPEKYPTWKFIIVPHEVDEKHLANIEHLFPATSIRFSVLSADPTRLEKSKSVINVLIIDNIGMLSSLYQYGKIAYIGGGFGAGIHNTLEAAAFGLPVIFGPKYKKFQEAKDLIAIGAAKSIDNNAELTHAFTHFAKNKECSAAAKDYVAKNKGATKTIVDFIMAES
ncbi:3-deoxy-D-manno-octulosonic-acid transferase [Pedobacter sp. UYP30]|uniref:3-deoxy-D-manno-octulosonic acid transferase n=1 Tax=Pedobacter sp. UYP30 TaxID=1756400 RepID=UPI003397EF85